MLGDRHQLAVLSRQRDALRVTARHLWFEARETAARLTADLDSTRTELAEMYELYEGMRASTSWRVTSPLRQAASLKDRKGATPGA